MLGTALSSTNPDTGSLVTRIVKLTAGEALPTAPWLSTAWTVTAAGPVKVEGKAWVTVVVSVWPVPTGAEVTVAVPSPKFQMNWETESPESGSVAVAAKVYTFCCMRLAAAVVTVAVGSWLPTIVMGSFTMVIPPLPSVAVAVTVSVPAAVKVWVMTPPVGSGEGGVRASPKSQATVTASPSASVVAAVKVCRTLA